MGGTYTTTYGHGDRLHFKCGIIDVDCATVDAVQIDDEKKSWYHCQWYSECGVLQERWVFESQIVGPGA